MLIEKIKGLKLKKPIEVVIEKFYTIECSDLNLHGDGKTKAELIKELKSTRYRYHYHSFGNLHIYQLW